MVLLCVKCSGSLRFCFAEPLHLQDVCRDGPHLGSVYGISAHCNHCKWCAVVTRVLFGFGYRFTQGWFHAVVLTLIC